jgi:phosphoglycolate phosphatase
MHHKTAIFDFDGTLVDTLPDFVEASRSFLHKRHLAPCNPLEVISYIGDGPREFVKRLLKSREMLMTDDDWVDFLNEYHHLDNQGAKLFDGMREVLVELQRNQYTCAICSNKPVEQINRILKKLELSNDFSIVVGGDTLSVRKPNPEMVMYILDRTGVTHESAIFLGDHLNDYLVATSCHVPFLFVEWGYGCLPQDAAHVYRSCQYPNQILQVLEPVCGLPLHGGCKQALRSLN